MNGKFEEIDMTYDEFSRMRQDGWLDIGKIVNVFSTNSREAIGNSDKTKNWLLFDDVPFLYKGIDCPKKESAGYAYAELIVEELAKQVGLEAAFYDLATYNGELGIITRSVVEKENQEMVSLFSILEEDKDSQDVEELMYNMIEALENQGITEDDIEKIENEYVKRRIFDLFIMAADTHTENISLLFEIDENGERRAKFAPIYDNESSLLLDYSASQMDLISRKGLYMYSRSYIDEAEPTLYYGDTWKEQLEFLTELEGGKEFVERCCSSLDMGEALKNVELKTGGLVPETIKKFVTFVFNERKSSIDNEMQKADIGGLYCQQIGDMSRNIDQKEFIKLLRTVFNEITPEIEDKIKKIENDVDIM